MYQLQIVWWNTTQPVFWMTLKVQIFVYFGQISKDKLIKIFAEVRMYRTLNKQFAVALATA